MIADGRHKQNLFCFLQALQTLYIDLMILIVDWVHMQQI